MTTRSILSTSIAEATFQRNVTDLCDWLHLYWFHTPDSRRTNPGWPDLVVLNTVTGRVLFLELKSERGRIRPKQTEVLNALVIGGHDVMIARPSQWPEVQRRLRDLATGGVA